VRDAPVVVGAALVVTGAALVVVRAALVVVGATVPVVGSTTRRTSAAPTTPGVPPTAVASVRNAPETALPVANDSATRTTPAPAIIRQYSTA